MTVALVATDDTDTTYVEIEATDAGRDAVPVWLTPDEAGTLAATLTSVVRLDRNYTVLGNQPASASNGGDGDDEGGG